MTTFIKAYMGDLYLGAAPAHYDKTQDLLERVDPTRNLARTGTHTYTDWDGVEYTLTIEERDDES